MPAAVVAALSAFAASTLIDLDEASWQAAQGTGAFRVPTGRTAPLGQSEGFARSHLSTKA